MTTNQSIAIQEIDPSQATYDKWEFFSSRRVIAAWKVILLLPFLLLSTFSSYSQTQHLKVISYNILNGFDWGKDTAREAELIAWVEAQQADVVALQELCGFNQEKLAQMAAKWGHDYALILKEDGYPVGLTSSQPIELKEKVREGLWHGMLHCQTQGVDFFLVHLSPADWHFRRREVKIIAEKIEATAEEMPKTKCRLDFILVSPELDQLCTKASIFNGEETHYLSDHFPVAAEFIW